jgi:LytS/YehU family sensor histidine kinase
MYEYILQYYREGFSYFFRTSDIFPNLYEIAATSLPAFFIKFSRIFAKNSSEKKQLEIDFLRLQINPHFLVNTLNNIYSLVVTEDTRSPDAILSLSNLLDYVLYESSLPEISMDKEVKFLQDFIQLEKIRNSKKVAVFFDVEGDMQGSIAPLILIAFVENAFKHGVGDSTLKSSIRIKLKMKEKNLSVEVINSKPTHTSSKRKTTLGGIGLNNVKKRLSSIYATQYELSVKDERNLYSVFLSIKLK